MVAVVECSRGGMGLCEELVGVELGTPVELEDGVLRVLLAQQRWGRKQLVGLNTHHIATDGVSHQVQWEEFGVACGAVADGVELELGGLELQYGDYAVWQRRWFGGELLEEELGWWKAALGEEIGRAHV